MVQREDYRVRVGRETAFLWLRAAGLVWRRLPAVFMDEADVNLEPKVGCEWMKRGEQATAQTRGTSDGR